MHRPPVLPWWRVAVAVVVSPRHHPSLTASHCGVESVLPDASGCRSGLASAVADVSTDARGVVGSTVAGAAAAVGLLLFGRFVFVIVFLISAIETFSPPAVRSMISSRASAGVEGAASR